MSGDRSPPWLDMKVSLGSLLTIATVAAGLVVWGVTAAGRADQAGRDLQDLKTSMEQRFNKVDSRLDTIDGKTVVIPTQGQRVEQLIKQHDDDMVRLGGIERRLGDIERLYAAFAAATTAQLDAVLHPVMPAVRATR